MKLKQYRDFLIYGVWSLFLIVLGGEEVEVEERGGKTLFFGVEIKMICLFLLAGNEVDYKSLDASAKVFSVCFIYIFVLFYCLRLLSSPPSIFPIVLKKLSAGIKIYETPFLLKYK